MSRILRFALWRTLQVVAGICVLNAPLCRSFH